MNVIHVEDSQSRALELTDNSSSMDKSDGQQHQDQSGTDQRSDQEAETGNDVSKQSIVDMFRDQDEYLRKLKEVREKFEESIRALSNERKFRRAKTDSTS
ncbi:hypothetical protein Btru_038094 [Bulinus truncatus]|nr:hypothetical protein Btru_038094 [Bulinus truncatus]